MGYLTLIRPVDVVDKDSFAAYCQQELGTPLLSNSRDLTALNMQLKAFWEANRSVWGNWAVFVQTIAWCKAKRKRPAFCYSIMGLVRYAWKDGCVPAMDPREDNDETLTDRLYDAIEAEPDESWRNRLIGATGIVNRREVLSEWNRVRSPALS